MTSTPLNKSVVSSTILNAFITDSFNLPAHWCYNSQDIQEKLVNPPVNLFEENPGKLVEPGKVNDYHKGKQAGDLTHYGDQMFWLLEQVAEKKGLDGWSKRWIENMNKYSGYKDHASKVTLENHESGKQQGSPDTDDLAGVSRFVPVLAVAANESDLIKLAQSQSVITHANPLVAQNSAAFFASWVYRAHADPKKAPSQILTELLQNESQAVSAYGQTVVDLIKKGRDLVNNSTFSNDQDAIDSLGEIKQYGEKRIALARACPYKGGLPATVYLVVKYEKQGLFSALKVNALIGGDNSSRGLLITAVLNPYSESNNHHLPAGWKNGFKLRDKVTGLLSH